MKVLLENAVCGIGSAGRFVDNIAELLIPGEQKTTLKYLLYFKWFSTRM